ALIGADVGVEATREIVDRLRERTRELRTRTATELRTLLTEELVGALDPKLDRALKATPSNGRPAVLLVVGVNGSGKTTTCGKIARVLVADGHSVVLGAADTFRAAAADQLATWAGRVGAEVVRGKQGGAPAAAVIDVQRRLNIPVKLVGLGEGPDDLAPFDPGQFVDALLGSDA